MGDKGTVRWAKGTVPGEVHITLTGDRRDDGCFTTWDSKRWGSIGVWNANTIWETSIPNPVVSYHTKARTRIVRIITNRSAIHLTIPNTLPNSTIPYISWGAHTLRSVLRISAIWIRDIFTVWNTVRSIPHITPSTKTRLRSIRPISKLYQPTIISTLRSIPTVPINTITYWLENANH